MLSYDLLLDAVANRAAIRRRRRLQPAGGPGDKLFPPTYPGEDRNDPPRHVFERRRIDGQEVSCVLIDSVQSQANRLEEALLEAAKEGSIRLPRVVVDFAKAGLNSVPEISSLEAPHRIFDAILRDSDLNGSAFRVSEIGKRIREAKTSDATAILQISPTALLFGAWNSTGEGGGVGAKFSRAIVSEIVAIGVPVEERVDRRSGEITLRSAGRRTGSRIDPLGILRSVEVYKSETGWDVTEAKAGKKAKKVRPSEINHGNIAPSIEALGITCDYTLQTSVLTLAGLRRLRFGDGAEKNATARAYLVALGLVALLEQDARGYALRSRCDLVCQGPAPLELIAFDGDVMTLDLDVVAARQLHEQAFDAALQAGFALSPQPLLLVPQDKLVEIVRRSQQKALSDEGGEAEDE
jgi:CRISPR-associated protein Csb1